MCFLGKTYSRKIPILSKTYPRSGSTGCCFAACAAL